MHYIALLVPSPAGEWSVLFPDLPECKAHGYTVDEAVIAAITASSQCMSKNGEAPRPPRDLSDIERDEDWLTRHHVDLSQAIVTMISRTA
jgi:predicted RNase H-like HicB family nuclease